MSDKNYLLNVILVIFVHLLQSQLSIANTSPTNIYDTTAWESTDVDTKIFESSTHSSHEVSTSKTDQSSTVDLHTVFSSVPDTSTSLTSTSLTSTSSPIPISSTSTISTVTTASIGTNITRIYRYTVASQVPLQIGNIADTTALKSVEIMVRASFNSTNLFNLTVTSIEIMKPRAKANYPHAYDMLVHILFRSSDMCNSACVDNTKLPSIPTQNFTLPDENGTLSDVNPTSGSLIYNVIETTPVTSPKRGESPPGRAAQLGMGLGISIIAVLLIVEIIFLYRKYGLTNPPRGRNYGISMSSI